MTYDPQAVTQYFDTFADQEWHRLDMNLQGRIKYAIHRKFIERHVAVGMQVLDVGSGPGRFAIDCAELGATVELVDISQVQLDLARSRIADRDLSKQITGFHCLDVLDMTSIAPNSFDVVVCFGGAISYTKEHYLDALRQLALVARPGSPILVSVMSLFGALRLVCPLDASCFLETADAHLDWSGVLSGSGIVYTRPGTPEFHQPLALFTSVGLRAALAVVGLEVVSIATANPFLPETLAVPNIVASDRAAQTLIDLEVARCEQPGLVDAGGHLIAVARKPTDAD